MPHSTGDQFLVVDPRTLPRHLYDLVRVYLAGVEAGRSVPMPDAADAPDGSALRKELNARLQNATELQGWLGSLSACGPIFGGGGDGERRSGGGDPDSDEVEIVVLWGPNVKAKIREIYEG